MAHRRKSPPARAAKGEAKLHPPMPARFPLRRFAIGPYPDVYADGCYGSGDHDTADLCAQWRAALAAEEAASAATLGNYIAGSGALLSLTSIILVLVVVGQTRKSNRIAEQTAERQLRAYVFPQTVLIVGMAEKRPIVTTIIENSGQTPAYNAIISVNSAIMRVGQEKFVEKQTAGPMVIPPHGTSTHTNFLKPDVISNTEAGLVSGELRLYVFGSVQHVDCFMARRKSTFRHLFSYRNSLAMGK